MNQSDLLNLIELVKVFERAASHDEILATLFSQLKHFGFFAYLITNLPLPREMLLHEHILANGWPAEWYAHYNAAGLYRHDPCAALCRNTAHPFLWSDIGKEGLEVSAQRVMDEAAEFGLRQGICVPIHVPFALPAVITVSGEAMELEPAVRQIVQILARQALESVLRTQTDRHHSQKPLLSEREREVLRWVADGKTSWEVSRILSISQHTVLTHQRNAKQKLEAVNNVHAVVKAILRQEIYP